MYENYYFKFIIYADMESLLDKTDTCHNNPEKSSTAKINKFLGICYLHIAYLMPQKTSIIILEAMIA